MERKKQIVITPEESKYIQKTFRVSTTTVWHALTYRRSNDIHRKIRKFAIERGGQQMVLSPEFDTIYITNREDADKRMTRYMIQTFENGAVLEGNLSTGMVTVRNKRGEVAYSYDNPVVTEIRAIQELAMSL